MRQDDGLDVLLLMRLLLFGLFMLAIAYTSAIVLMATRAFVRTPQRSSEAEARLEIQRVSSVVMSSAASIGSGDGLASGDAPAAPPRLRPETTRHRRCRALLDYLATLSPVRD